MRIYKSALFSIVLCFVLCLTAAVFTGCYQLDNPVDPAADSYQGYEATRITDELLNSVFVSSAAGDDISGEGTYNNPFASIQQGLALAAANGFPAVRVAEGYYPVDGAGFPAITMIEGISLYGGYSYPDWFHAPEFFVTEVIDERPTGGSSGIPNRCFTASGGISGATEISGFHIFGSGGYSASIFCNTGSAPVISGNYIDGGINTAATETYGIVCNEAAPVIENNMIIGGHGNITMAVDIFGTYNPVIRNNSIFGGEAGSTSYGINCLQTANPVIEDNEIDGGRSFDTYGMLLNNSSPEIRNNRIRGGQATGISHGIYLSLNSFPLIEANEIEGGEAFTVRGVHCEDGGDAVILHNTIEGGAGDTVTALSIVNSSPLIYRNTFHAGNGGNTLSGITLIASLARIEGNRIISGFSNDKGYGIKFSDGSNGELLNNIISAEEAFNLTTALHCYDSSPIIRNNLLFGGFSAVSYGIDIESFSVGSGPFIENNIILGGPNGRGINILDTNSYPAILQHNDIFDSPNGLYADTVNGIIYDISAMEAVNPGSYFGNVSVDPVFADPSTGDVRLTSSSPAQVREGGLDGGAMGWTFNDDIKGKVRTGNGSTGWSMGPHEYD